MFSSGVGFSSLTKPIPVACGSSNSKRCSAPDLQADIARKTEGRKQIEALYRDTKPLFIGAYAILCATSVSLDRHQVGVGIQFRLRDREQDPIGLRYRLGLLCLRYNTESNQVLGTPAFSVV